MLTLRLHHDSPQKNTLFIFGFCLEQGLCNSLCGDDYNADPQLGHLFISSVSTTRGITCSVGSLFGPRSRLIRICSWQE